jgi:hypothetical protein
MQPTPFFLAKAMPELKDWRCPVGKKALHAQLWRGLKILLLGKEQLYVSLWDGNGKTQRGIDFDKALAFKELSDKTEQGCTAVQPGKTQHAAYSLTRVTYSPVLVSI